MLKKILIAGATGALLTTTAFAQTPSTTAPAMNAPATTDSATPATAGTAKFVTSQTADQWLGSKFKGTDVIGTDNAKIGDVGDVVFDKSGKIVAVVVGVGGFLGIGQKDVALDMTAFQVVPASTGAATTTTSTAPAAAADPNDVKLKLSMTKDELKNAPAFVYYKAPPRTAGSAAPAGNTGTAPAAPR